MKKSVLLLFIILLTCFTKNLTAQPAVENPQVKWRFKTSGPIRADAVVDGQQIFVASTDGRLYSLRKRDGGQLWAYESGGALAGEPAVSANTVVVISRDNNVHAVNRKTGQVKWKFLMQPEEEIGKSGWKYFTAAPVIANGKVYVGSGDGHLYALDQKTGRLDWKFRTNGQIRATPLVSDNIVYQPSNDGIVYVLNAVSGNLLWTFETDGVQYNPDDFGFDRKSIYPTPILVGDILIIGSRDGNVYAIDTQTRTAKWKFAYDTTWAMSTAVDETTVYVGWSTNDLFSAIDLQTGQEKWKFTAGSHNYTTAFVNDTSVYFGSADGKLYRLDKNSGDRIWEYGIGSEIFSSPVYDQGTNTLFVGSDNEFLYAIENGKNAYRAVYLPTGITDITQYLIVDPKVTPFLVNNGYEHLDSQERLRQFIENRIADGAPSVIVFALPNIPDKIIGENPQSGLMRNYLEAGGKVVWFGDPPNYYTLNETGSDFLRDATPGSKLLGVEFFSVSDSGNYFSRAVQEGLNWGLPERMTTTATAVKKKNVTPLAFDEFGRVSAWVKNFHSRPGSGYVSLRTWGWNVPIKDDDLALILEVADYGLE